MKKILPVMMLATAGLMLAACDNNPLQSQLPEQQISLLLEASRAAEKDMGLYSPPGGAYYLSCMKDNEAHIDCPLLFRLMLAHLQRLNGFANVRLAAITDQAFFAPLAVDYQARFFNAVEGA